MEIVFPIAGEGIHGLDVRYPVELRPGRGFKVDRPATWPRLEGRLEFVKGRLLYMPPCGDEQQDVAVDLAFVLGRWARTHRDFVVGGNEAGMVLGGDARAADAAVWRRSSLGPRTGGFRRVPPVLAAEVAGLDEDEDVLLKKCGWYLDHGVEVVWLLFPRRRDVLVVTPFARTRVSGARKLPKHASLPGLAPRAAELFRQLDD